MGRPINPSNPFTLHIFKVSILPTLIDSLNNADSILVKNAGGHEQWILKSLNETIQWTYRELGYFNFEHEWRWGKIHTINMPHTFHSNKYLRNFFDVGPFETGGDETTLKQSGFDWSNGYDQAGWASHYRTCMDLSNWENGGRIHIPGQSGDPSNKHYDDMFTTWDEGEYHPLYWKRETVEKHQQQKIVLVKN